jgi:16S rRNA (guanine527-N7)-methyltransferase
MLLAMEARRIAELLRPFLAQDRLGEDQLSSISSYIDILLKWNARMNLTAVRDPEQIVRRHFGESLFVARHLVAKDSSITVADVGSGAGFPGIPLKIYAPGIHLTLIEAHGKKATFLREVCRSLALTNVSVFGQRAEQWQGAAAVVTLRAVEKFERILPVAASLLVPQGTLGLLIGSAQASQAEAILPGSWSASLPIPDSRERVLRTWQRD